MKAIYYMKLARLSPQLDFLDYSLSEEIKIVAEFVSCFYALWYLQADEVVKAPYLELIAIQQMYKYRGVTENKEAVNKVIGNLMKHTW